MKKLFLITSGLALVAGLLGIVVLSPTTNPVRAGAPPPTAAPTRTPGPPPPIEEFVGPYLEHPLNEAAAVQRAFEIDQQYAKWDKAWSPDDAGKQSSRITVQWHAERDYDGAYYGPGTERGPVWVIIIKGRVRWNGLHGDDKTHQGITYVIAQKTGNLLRVRVGPTR